MNGRESPLSEIYLIMHDIFREENWEKELKILGIEGYMKNICGVYASNPGVFGMLYACCWICNKKLNN